MQVIVGGDCNVRLENSARLSELVADGSRSDAASLFSTATGTPIQDTCQTTMGSSRIDMQFMNPAATRILKHCCVVDISLDGIKRHKPAEERWSYPGSLHLRFDRYGALPKKQTDIDPGENDLLIEETITEEVGTFHDVYFDDDADTMWGCWCKLAGWALSSDKGYDRIGST